jgi:hypothetical protein
MNRTYRKPLTLKPLSFDEAVTGILKIKREPKQPKIKPAAKKQADPKK